MRARAAGALGYLRVRWRGVVPVVLFGLSILFTVHYVNAANHKFCQVVTAATATPVARPANPAANPSREQAWEWYERYAQLGRSLGC